MCVEEVMAVRASDVNVVSRKIVPLASRAFMLRYTWDNFDVGRMSIVCGVKR
jgi:hypothetical protein